MYHKLYLVFAIITNNKIHHSECLTLNAVKKQKNIKASFSKPSSLLLVWLVLHNNNPSETTTNVGSTRYFVSDITFLMVKKAFMYNLSKLRLGQIRNYYQNFWVCARGSLQVSN